MKAHSHPCVGCHRDVFGCTQECNSTSHRNMLIGRQRPNIVCDRCAGVDRVAAKARRREAMQPKPRPDPRWPKRPWILASGKLLPHTYEPDASPLGMGDCVCGHVADDSIHVRVATEQHPGQRPEQLCLPFLSQIGRP